MTIETVTVTDKKNNRILGKAVLENLSKEETKVSQSTLIREGLYEISYDYVKQMIENYSNLHYGKEIEIKYN